MEVGIRELKLRLSEYVARVRRGETVVVTSRGRPVARLEAVTVEVPAALRGHVTNGRVVFRPPPRVAELPAPLVMAPGVKNSTDYLREGRR